MADSKKALAADLEKVQTQLDRVDHSIRNILFNVEQDPDRYTMRDLLHSMRSAIGLQPGEKP